MATESVATDLCIPLRTVGEDGLNASRPYATAAFDLIRGVEGMADEVFAVAVNADCNARSVGVSHPDFAAMIQAPGTLGPFAKTEDGEVLGRQMAQIEARLPEAHSAAQAAGVAGF